MKDTPVEVLRQLAQLYELSLSVGGSLDMQDCCDRFSRLFLSRKQLAWVVIYLRQDNGTLQRVYTLPLSEHPALLPADSRLYSMTSGAHVRLEEGRVWQMSGPSEAQALALGDEGWMLVGSSRPVSLSPVEVNQLRGVLEKLGIALRACQHHAALGRVRSQLEAQAIQLHEAQEHAEQASRHKSDFVAQLSHELRTPLTAITGYADLLDRDITPAERAQTLRNLRLNSQHLLSLVRDVVELSSIEAGEVRVELEAVDVVQLVLDVGSMMRPRAESRGLRFSTTLGTDLPRYVLTDGKRVRQVMVNLVANAIKYTRDGRIEISVNATADEVMLEVNDTGIGISNEDQQRLFAPYTRMAPPSDGESTGLGLHIAKQFADALQGRLEVQSTLGVGSFFTLVLPRREPERADPATEAETPDLSGRRVLIAEDTPDIQRILLMYVEDTGADADVVADGRAAVRAVQSSPGFDLVLMDIQMPHLDGYAATRRIRSMGLDIPILAVTASGLAEDAQRARAAGCNGWLAKPVQPGLLWRAMVEQLGETDDTPLVSSYANVDRMRPLLQQYLDDLSITRIEFEQAIADQARERVLVLAHQIRGGAGSYGYPQLSQGAAVLDNRLRSGASLLDCTEEVRSLQRLLLRMPARP